MEEDFTGSQGTPRTVAGDEEVLMFFLQLMSFGLFKFKISLSNCYSYSQWLRFWDGGLVHGKAGT